MLNRDSLEHCFHVSQNRSSPRKTKFERKLRNEIIPYLAKNSYHDLHTVYQKPVRDEA